MNQKVLQKKTKSSVTLPSIKPNNDSNRNQYSINQNQLRKKKQILVKPPLQQSLKVQTMNEFLDKSTDYPLPQESENLFNIATDIYFEAKVLYDKIEISKSQLEAVPIMIRLAAKEKMLGSKLGLDIVCVVDRSFSMTYELVKESLNVLIDFLQSKDRLSVIIFNHDVQVLFKLKKMTKEKKIKIKQKIEDITFTGDRNAADAIQQAFQQLRHRKQANHVAAVFLMTSGQNVSSQVALEQAFANIDFPYTFHSLGFGCNLDDDFLMKLSSLGNGNFYYVPNIEMLNEALIDALGGLISIVGQQISIMIQCHPKEPFNQICISPINESKWDAKGVGRFYSIQFPVFQVGQNLDLAFELSLPNLKQLNGKQMAKQNKVTACIAILKIQCPISQRFYTKICSLKLNLIIESVVSQLADLDVAVSYFRGQITCIIEKARQSCKQGYYDEAKNDLNQAIVDLSEYTNFIEKSQWMPFFIEELKWALQASEKKSYKTYGKILMMQMVQNNFNQNGITVRFTNSDSQQISPHADLYQYTESRDLVQQLLFSRQTSCSDDQLN